jgi:hypothetical protein
MNVEIGAEAALFPEKEYIYGFSLQCRHGASNVSVFISALSIYLLGNCSVNIRVLLQLLIEKKGGGDFH